MKSKGIGNLKSKGIGGYVGTVILGRCFNLFKPSPNGRAVLNNGSKNIGKQTSKILAPRTRKAEHNK